MRIVLVSFFDSGNLGDLLIAHSLVDSLAQFGSVLPLSYSGNPRTISDVDHLHLTFTPAQIGGMRASVRRLVYRLGAERVLRAIRTDHRGFAWITDTDITRILRDAHVVVIGGGNMISDSSPWTSSWEAFNSIALASKNQGCAVVGLSLGIGPFCTHDQTMGAISALELCDAVTFRDRASLDLYRRHSSVANWALAADPVFNMEVQPPELPTRGCIAVNFIDSRLTGISRRKARHHVNSYVELVKDILSSCSNSVVLFSTDLNDFEVLKEVEQRVASPRCEFRPTVGIRDVRALYERSSVVVASRMHSLMTAYIHLRPVLGISWQTKVDEFFDIVGAHGDVWSIDQLGLEQRGKLVTRLREMLGDLEREESQIRERLPVVRARCAVNDAIVKNIVGDASPESWDVEDLPEKLGSVRWTDIVD